MKNRAKICAESDSKWQRQEKPTKIASGAVSGRTFSAPGSFSVDFGLPDGPQNWQKKRSGATRGLFFDHTFPIFGRFVRSGVFRERPGSILEAPRTPPDQILQRFCKVFLPVPSGSCRGLSGSAGMLPGYTASLRNSLCGVSLGYGDLAERIKFAVSQRG